MNKRCISVAVALFLSLASVTQAFDTIKTATRTLSGRIVGMDATKIDFKQGIGGALQQVPVNAIQMVYFEAEPAELKTAKKHILDGHYADALAALERIRETPSRVDIRNDIDFYAALCAAKMALGGSMKISTAGKMMRNFFEGHPRSYHYFEAAETVGDLLVALGEYDLAAQYYDRLNGAPWPDYQMRASVAAGRSLLRQGKIREAAAEFDKVLAANASGESAQVQRTAARLGKASTLTALKEPGEAVAIAEDIINNADPEDAPVLARAYNVLGTAQRQAGRIKEALLAFLHVDILYSSVPDAHAESLANLAELWEQIHKIDRANRARQILEAQYPNSPWAKQKRS